MKFKIFSKLKDTMGLGSFLSERFIVGIIIAAITFGFTYFTKKYAFDYTVDIFAAILVLLLVFVLYIVKDAHKIYELRDRMEKADKVYADMLSSHNKLPSDYSKFMDSAILNTVFKNGIAMLNINDGQYKSLLEDCSKNLQNSYYASFTIPYSIKNIFNKDSENHDYVSVSEIISFLKNMDQKLDGAKIKKRVYIFDKEKFITDIEGVKVEDSKDLVELFKVQSSSELFFIDKTKLKNNSRLNSRFESILEADFAVFDESLAFRRTDKQELCFYFMNDLYKTLPRNFKEVYQSESFKYNPGIFYSLSETENLIRRKDYFNKEEIGVLTENEREKTLKKDRAKLIKCLKKDLHYKET